MCDNKWAPCGCRKLSCSFVACHVYLTFTCMLRSAEKEEGSVPLSPVLPPKLKACKNGWEHALQKSLHTRHRKGMGSRERPLSNLLSVWPHVTHPMRTNWHEPTSS